MPKKKRARKPRRRPQPHRNNRPLSPSAESAEPDLLAAVRRMLRGSHPHELLQFVSSLLAVVEPRVDPFSDASEPAGPTLADLVESFVGIRRPETTAVLAVMAELVGDELAVRRIRRELAARDEAPAWLQQLGPLHVERVVEMGHVLGDGDNIMIGVRTGSGLPLTVIAYVDHNLGTVATDGFVILEPHAVVLDSFREASAQDPDTTYRELDPGEARARLREAIDLGAMTFPPLETDTWPAARPLVEWVLRQLPPGGTGYERPKWDDDDRRRLTERFRASPFARGHDEEDLELLDTLLWFGCDYGPGDPLRWSPVSVEMLLADWLPRKVIADVGFLDRAPALLRSFIRFSHAERGLRSSVTEETLAAVNKWEPEYRRTIRSSRPRGPAALLAMVGLDNGEGGPPGLLDEGRAYDEIMLDVLRDTVGDSLEEVDVYPLPDEALDLSFVPEDLHDRVREVGRLVDACCDDLFDVEHRTACRRLLADVAEGDPAIFRRRARSDTAAAAIVWVVAKANSTFSQHAGGLTAKRVGEWFGVGNNPGQRAQTMLAAINAPGTRYAGMYLGTPRYLVADRRRWVVETRERYRHAQSP